MDKKKVKELSLDVLTNIKEAISRTDDVLLSLTLANIASKIALIGVEVNKSDWVSVEEGLPEYGENVLAISKDGYMNVSYRRKIPRDKISREVMDDNGFILNFNLCCSTITHWKPIEKLEE